MRIAIVGGGLSGLAVALGCEEAGHDVSLYEASDQLGGRMMTRPEGQHLIDLGSVSYTHLTLPTIWQV